ncbi:MAG TPA: hypothetical protein VIH83_02525 [Candidatus Bathyarchaeia archaeon]
MTSIDTNIFVAALNERDEDHRKCKVLLEMALEKREWLCTWFTIPNRLPHQLE